MTHATSLWGRVTERYEQPVELRAGELGGRFHASFRGATLVIRKSNGVERVVDFDEFRASWRTLAAGGSDDALRRITGNGMYLRAVREDLIAQGVDPAAETVEVGSEDLNSGEASLLSTAGAPQAPTEAGAAGTASDAAAVQAMLDRERAEKDEALRENARLVASLEVIEVQLREETERAARLEQVTLQAPPTASTQIGSRTDVAADLLAASGRILGESATAPELRKAAETAIDLARRDPASAVTKARVITELLVRREWATVFAADAGSTRKSFNDYARELEGQRQVNMRLLAIKRTLHRVANPGAHELQVSPRLAALVVLVLVSVLDSESRTNAVADRRAR
jgi:hypothetical protein